MKECNISRTVYPVRQTPISTKQYLRDYMTRIKHQTLHINDFGRLFNTYSYAYAYIIKLKNNKSHT